MTKEERPLHWYYVELGIGNASDSFRYVVQAPTIGEAINNVLNYFFQESGDCAWAVNAKLATRADWCDHAQVKPLPKIEPS